MAEEFHLVDKVKTDKGTFRVSTKEFPEYIETMIFGEDGLNLAFPYQQRYRTKEEAEISHKKILKALNDGNFSLTPSEYNLEIRKEFEMLIIKNKQYNDPNFRYHDDYCDKEIEVKDFFGAALFHDFRIFNGVRLEDMDNALVEIARIMHRIYEVRG